MPHRHVGLSTSPVELLEYLRRLRAELDIPAEFSPQAQADASAAAARDPGGADRRDIPFVTIDPPASTDLDQALHLERRGDGFRVHYAISAVGTLIEPGSALDEEVRARGVTVYGPGHAFPLHPEVLSAGAASLLPGQDRPAYLWTLELAADGTARSTTVELARVRSRAKLSYAQVQHAADTGRPLPDGAPADLPGLLRTVGGLRLRIERERGGVSLDIPEQVVVRTDRGYHLEFERTLPVESWNAQISLLTGMEAAKIMRAAGTGILRTLPPADERDVRRLRHAARALGVRWERGVSYPDLVRTLDSAVPANAAFIQQAATLFRGAAYAAFDGGAPAHPLPHAAIAAEYAHVTAPLRRLVDRYGLEVCLAHCSGTAVPDAVRAGLAQVPALMEAATHRANAYERGAVDTIEALVLQGHEDERFRGVVIDVDERGRNGIRRGDVLLRELAVEGRVSGPELPLGEEVEVLLAETDPAARRVTFELLGPVG